MPSHRHQCSWPACRYREHGADRCQEQGTALGRSGATAKLHLGQVATEVLLATAATGVPEPGVGEKGSSAMTAQKSSRKAMDTLLTAFSSCADLTAEDEAEMAGEVWGRGNSAQIHADDH